MRVQFLTALIQLLKIENNPITIQALEKMTAHIQDNQFTEFIERLSKGKQFARPMELVKSVADEYMEDIKSELFKTVEADAKLLNTKLETHHQ